MGASTAFPALFGARWKVLALTSTTVLTPLCLLRSFSFLAYTSLVGIAGTLYTAVGVYARKREKEKGEKE